MTEVLKKCLLSLPPLLFQNKFISSFATASQLVRSGPLTAVLLLTSKGFSFFEIKEFWLLIYLYIYLFILKFITIFVKTEWYLFGRIFLHYTSTLKRMSIMKIYQQKAFLLEDPLTELYPFERSTNRRISFWQDILLEYWVTEENIPVS